MKLKTKAQYSHWVSKMSPRPKKAWQVQSNVEVMFAVLLNCEDIIHHKFLLMARRWTRNIIWRWWKRWGKQWGEKGPVCGGGKKWMLHCDNAPVHFSLWFMIFSQNVRWHSSPSLFTHQTLHQQTYFSSPTWNPYWKEDNLSLSRSLWMKPTDAL